MQTVLELLFKSLFNLNNFKKILAEDEISLTKEDVLDRVSKLNFSALIGLRKTIREVVNKVGDKMKVSSSI